MTNGTTRTSRHFAKITLSCAALVTLSACVTTASAPPAQVQSTITNASMISEGASCNQIAQGIQQMDQIIVATTGNTTSSYNTNNNTFSGTKQTLNNHLYQSDAYRENSGIASDLMRMVTGSNTTSTKSQLEYQQSRDAQQQKSRLVSLFQQKKCVAQ